MRLFSREKLVGTKQNHLPIVTPIPEPVALQESGEEQDPENVTGGP